MPFAIPPSLAIFIATLVALALSGMLFRFGKGALKPTATLLIIGIWLWLGAAQFMSRRGLFADLAAFQSGDLGDFLLFNTLFVLPVVVLVILWFRIPSFRSLSASLPIAALVGLQVYRVGGLAYLQSGIDGTLPAYMGYVTGWADLTVGLTAVVVAFALATGKSWARPAALLWCVLGLLDFVNGAIFVNLAFFDLIDSVPDPVRMGRDPFLLICLFQAPLAIALHALVIWRIIKMPKASA